MPVRIGPSLQIKDLIAEATKAGCELRISKGQLATPWGPKYIRYLFNPTNRGRYDITDYEDDETMLGFELAAVERRLGIKFSYT